MFGALDRMAGAVQRRYSGVGAIIMLVVGVIALILVLHIIFVLFGANSANSIVSTDADWARHLAAWFDGLFNTANGKWNTVLNYGIATIVYLVVGRLLAGLLERV
jgi:hypothetical protein